MKPSFAPHKIKSLQPLGRTVIVEDMLFDQRQLSSGVILLNDKICVAHGRWTRGVEIEDAAGVRTIRKVDPMDILLVSAEQPDDSTMSDAIQSQARDRFNF